MGIPLLKTMTTDNTTIAFEQSGTFVAALTNAQSTESNFASNKSKRITFRYSYGMYQHP